VRREGDLDIKYPRKVARSGQRAQVPARRDLPEFDRPFPVVEVEVAGGEHRPIRAEVECENGVHLRPQPGRTVRGHGRLQQGPVTGRAGTRTAKEHSYREPSQLCEEPYQSWHSLPGPGRLQQGLAVAATGPRVKRQIRFLLSDNYRSPFLAWR